MYAVISLKIILSEDIGFSVQNLYMNFILQDSIAHTRNDMIWIYNIKTKQFICVSVRYKNKIPLKQPWKCSCMSPSCIVWRDRFILIMWKRYSPSLYHKHNVNVMSRKMSPMSCHETLVSQEAAPVFLSPSPTNVWHNLWNSLFYHVYVLKLGRSERAVWLLSNFIGLNSIKLANTSFKLSFYAERT
jgi:hypothetical protein